jgi:hypothetical protein
MLNPRVQTPSPPVPRQLPLPLPASGPAPPPLPPLPPTVAILAPLWIWPTRAPPLQAHVRRTLVHLLEEVLANVPPH